MSIRNYTATVQFETQFFGFPATARFDVSAANSQEALEAAYNEARDIGNVTNVRVEEAPDDWDARNAALGETLVGLYTGIQRALEEAYELGWYTTQNRLIEARDKVEQAHINITGRALGGK